MRKMFFSIIIPTYNRAEIVKTAIQSVKAQTYPEWELIVVDDGGSDKTKEVVEAFSDRRIKYFWKENGERGAARNFGVQKARGDYITFLDSDDKFLPNHLEDALYTKEAIPVILESFSSKNVISISSNEIIKMYCFIYENIKNELGEEVDSIIKKLSNEFRNKYLNSNKSIFESKSIAEQCKILLEKFRKNTLLLKDTKKYYDAIYKFLYFEINDNDGLVMGINNFYSIWEELCFDYFFNNFKDKIYCADYEKECNLKNKSKEIKRRIFLSDEKIENYPFKLIVNTIKENEKTCSTT
jgi:glycosyltransferase involved in cell wall biosynthesis